MHCYHANIDGHAVIICVGTRTPRCAFCRAQSTLLCDAPLTTTLGGGTIDCDAPICPAHAKSVGGKDYCPRHWHLAPDGQP